MAKRTKAQMAREEAGLSLEDAAKAARLGARYVRQLEMHGRAPYATARRLARIYGCRVDYFLYPRAAEK
jgi:transcriptional regulator with XRE-family HTH domain